MYLFIFHLIMELQWLRNVVKRVSFICFSFLVLSFLKQLLVKLQQTNFCVKRDKIFLSQNIGFIGDSHACTKRAADCHLCLRFYTLNKPPSSFIFIHHHHQLVVCFGYLLSVVVIQFFRYQSHFKSQTTRTTEKIANSEDW